jgi:hypothetical protein
MSTATRTALEAQIDELHEEAANALAWKAHVEAAYPWRRHDSRIYAERAQVALQAARHLMEEL